MSTGDEFYIGYEPSVPPAIKRRVRATVWAALVVTLALAGALTLAQRPLARSSFQYGRHEAWAGFLRRTPAPALLVPSPSGHTRYWLVGRGKHGAEAALEGVVEGWVEVVGTLISRDEWRMLEIISVTSPPAPAGVAAPPGGAAPPGAAMELDGEIVDSKCFLGVMNPGERVVHRDCAVRCLSGGVPPMFAFRDAEGRRDLAVLVDASGRRLHDDLSSMVGRPVRLGGSLFQIDGQPVFQLSTTPGVGR